MKTQLGKDIFSGFKSQFDPLGQNRRGDPGRLSAASLQPLCAPGTCLVGPFSTCLSGTASSQGPEDLGRGGAQVGPPACIRVLASRGQPPPCPALGQQGKYVGGCVCVCGGEGSE